MLALKPNCAVCRAVKADKRLLNRIYESSWYVKHSKDSLMKIQADCKGMFSYPSLKNHVKKHQFINASDYTKQMTKLAAKRAETGVIAKNIESINVWDKVISIAQQKLDQGELEVKVSDLLKAAKDKSDYQFKKSDQQLQLMETIAHFASGENTNNERVHDRRIIEAEPYQEGGDTLKPGQDIDSWQGQSSDFYKSITGSPSPSGAS